MFKFNYKLIDGIYEDADGVRPCHIVIIRHRLLTNKPRRDGRGYEITDEAIVETFTRLNKEIAREDAHRRVGELMFEA